jgi:hypothetical protein
MPELSIRLTADAADQPIRAALYRVDTGTYTEPAPFTPSFEDKHLADLC